MKIQLIDNCVRCADLRYNVNNGCAFCDHKKSRKIFGPPQERVIGDVNMIKIKIPKWCPLEDKK